MMRIRTLLLPALPTGEQPFALIIDRVDGIDPAEEGGLERVRQEVRRGLHAGHRARGRAGAHAVSESAPHKVMIDAHGIDIRIEGTEPTAELAKLAVSAFDHALEATPSHRTIGFASGSNVRTDLAYDDRVSVTLRHED